MTEQVVQRFKMRRPAVAVAIPMANSPQRDAMQSLLTWLTTGDFRPGYDVFIPRDAVAVVHITRNLIINDFLQLPNRFQYLIMVDDDMTVPANLIDIWVGNENARLPFISGYCTRKSYPFLPIPAMLKEKGTKNLFGQDAYVYDPITNWPPGSGLQECDGIGMACVCIRRDVLEAMEPPWFAMENSGGEDYYFCRKLQALRTKHYPKGVQVLVDTNTTIGHVGSLVATPEHWFTSRDKWLADTGRSEYDLIGVANGELQLPADEETEAEKEAEKEVSQGLLELAAG